MKNKVHLAGKSAVPPVGRMEECRGKMKDGKGKMQDGRMGVRFHEIRREKATS